MSDIIKGIQFPIVASTKKISTTASAKYILSSAIQSIDPHCAEIMRNETTWRKNYPIHIKKTLELSLKNTKDTITIAQSGLKTAHEHFRFYRHGLSTSFKNAISQPFEKLQTDQIIGKSNSLPEWYIPYKGKQLRGQSLLNQIQLWQEKKIIEPSHAEALRKVYEHPEWLDLSDRTMVLLGAGAEIGPLSWLAKWKANIIAIDIAHLPKWTLIRQTIEKGNATLYAPFLENNKELGADLLTQTPEIVKWLNQFNQNLDIAALAYLDGEKHVRVALAMDAIMQSVSEKNKNTSLMFMSTPTDIYALPISFKKEIEQQQRQRSFLEKSMTQLISQFSCKKILHKTIFTDYSEKYTIYDGLVLQQGPNYALAKRLQQWRALVARHQGQCVSINVSPSTTTQSVIKNPLLQSAFNGASLFGVEAFAPETTNAIMAAMWVHDLRYPKAVSQPNITLTHPLDLISSGANHGGLWRTNYTTRTVLPMAALYGNFKNKKRAIY